jgi:hypothetical protein
MKLQRTPLILLLIALVLGGFVYFYEVQGAPQREAAQANAEKLFQFKEEEVQTLNLTSQKQTLSFVKTPAGRLKDALKQQLAQEKRSKPETLIWLMTAPLENPANEASIAYLLNLMATGKTDQQFQTPAARLAEFGLDNPLARVEVKLSNQQTHKLLLGKPNFNRTALYAQIDPPATPTTDVSVALVSMDFETAVSRPLSEWQQPKQKPEQTGSPGKPVKE